MHYNYLLTYLLTHLFTNLRRLSYSKLPKNTHIHSNKYDILLYRLRLTERLKKMYNLNASCTNN